MKDTTKAMLVTLVAIVAVLLGAAALVEHGHPWMGFVLLLVLASTRWQGKDDGKDEATFELK